MQCGDVCVMVIALAGGAPLPALLMPLCHSYMLRDACNSNYPELQQTTQKCTKHCDIMRITRKPQQIRRTPQQDHHKKIKYKNHKTHTLRQEITKK
jgi:hypothetical protein